MPLLYRERSADTTQTFVIRIDSKLVMAEQSVHDAVDQAQSAGGPSPADVSATKSTDSAAPAAVDNATILRNPDNLHTLPDSTPEHMFADPESLSDLLSGTSENDKVWSLECL